MEEIINKVLDYALKEGAKFAEARYQDLRYNEYVFINGEIRNINTGLIKGLSLIHI